VQRLEHADQVEGAGRLFGEVDVSATSNVTRSATPAAAAFDRASSIDASSRSTPWTRAWGNDCANTMLDHPTPQPASSTRPPVVRDCTASGSASSHEGRSAVKIGRLRPAIPCRISEP